jgi:CheY-like chemotaxis protein
VPPSSSYKVVLIVEDDTSTRDYFRSVLRGHGYSVAAVDDGLAALQVIESDPPNVIVLDIGLPRLGGADVLRELRANPATRMIPVIIVTGNDVTDMNERAGCPVLQKPVDPAALTDAVENAFRRAAR